MDKNIWWLIFILLLIGTAWAAQYKQGGPGGVFGWPETVTTESVEPKPAAFSPPPTETPTPSASPTISPAAKTPTMRINATQAKAAEANKEYITLENVDFEKKTAIPISGLVLKNKNNESVIIGGDENNGVIHLASGERAVIVTGQSPKGYNFKINKCSGYFNQHDSFAPFISTFCPMLQDLPETRSLKDKCVDYIERIPACQMVTPGLESGIDFECSEFVARHASYAGCAEDHKNDADFDQREWRIYLGKSQEFWGNRHDTIRLLDQSGNPLAELEY